MRIRSGLLLCVALTACRQDMHDQPKYIPLRASGFFEDGRSARPIPEGTVARGHLNDNTASHTVTRAVLERGRERYNVFCSPCHDHVGTGEGMIVRRGYRRPPSYHTERLRAAAPAYFVDVITKGFGAMPDYASQIAPADRWAIAAYIKALQLSQNATVQDVPPGGLK